MKPRKAGIARIIDAFGYSMKGINFAWQNEAAFRQECCLAFVLLPLAFFIAENAVQLVLLILPVFIVLIVELLNSAIEAVVDRHGDELHILSGAAKDIASAAVFFSLILLGLIWMLILIDIILI